MENQKCCVQEKTLSLKLQARNEWWWKWRPPLPFFENSKKCLGFGKNCPNCVHHCVESSNQNVVFGLSSIKSFNIFPYGAFDKLFAKKARRYSCFFGEKFIEVP